MYGMETVKYVNMLFTICKVIFVCVCVCVRVCGKHGALRVSYLLYAN